MLIDRAFVRISEGQAHYRHTPNAPQDPIPLVLVHMSPVASAFLLPLMNEFGDKQRQLVAPDTLGNGDSIALNIDNPEITDFADGLRRVLDAIGIERAHIYGIRTGAMIATEFAIKNPDRTSTLILDELVAVGPSEASITGSTGEKCPPIDAFGSQFVWAWHVMRDHNIWHPWWHRYGSNRITLDLPSADDLHTHTMELLKAIRTFHYSYSAAMRWPRRSRIPLIRVPSMVLNEPTHEAFPSTAKTVALIDDVEAVDLPPGDTSQQAKAKVIRNWLSAK